MTTVGRSACDPGSRSEPRMSPSTRGSTADVASSSTRRRGLRTSALGLDPKAGHLIWGADIALAADGRWLLCTERSESTVAAVELDGEGRLTDKVVFTDTEAQPRGLTVGPDGTTVIVVGEVSGHASLYRLADNGTMVLSDRVETGKGPNWVRFV